MKASQYMLGWAPFTSDPVLEYSCREWTERQMDEAVWRENRLDRQLRRPPHSSFVVETVRISRQDQTVSAHNNVRIQDTAGVFLSDTERKHCDQLQETAAWLKNVVSDQQQSVVSVFIYEVIKPIMSWLSVNTSTCQKLLPARSGGKRKEVSVVSYRPPLTYKRLIHPHKQTKTYFYAHLHCRLTVGFKIFTFTQIFKHYIKQLTVRSVDYTEQRLPAALQFNS